MSEFDLSQQLKTNSKDQDTPKAIQNTLKERSRLLNIECQLIRLPII